MSQFSLDVNREQVTVDAAPETPVLWVLRDSLGLTGTKYGCGIGVCGSCTVHLDGSAVRSSVTPVSSDGDSTITNIEGLATDALHPVQEAWLEESVAQCGYCQPGQIMTATALLARNPIPDDEEIDRVMSGVLCRCGTYLRIKKAVRNAGKAQ